MERLRRALGWLERRVNRRGALALFLVALAVYAIQSLAVPLVAGRDLGTYLRYYAQFGDSSPPLPMAMLFRTPVAPFAVGVPLDLGGAALAQVWLGLLYAASIVAWSATAAVFGARSALLTAALLLVFPGYGILFHALASDAIFAAVFAGWALVVSRATVRRSVPLFVAAGLFVGALALTRPGNQVLLLFALFPLVLARVVALAPVGGRRLPRRGRLRTRALGRAQRCPLRRLRGRAGKRGLHPLLPDVRLRPHRQPGERPGVPQARAGGRPRAPAARAVSLLRRRRGHVLPPGQHPYARGPREPLRPRVGLGQQLQRAAPGGVGGAARPPGHVCERRDADDLAGARAARVRRLLGAGRVRAVPRRPAASILASDRRRADSGRALGPVHDDPRPERRRALDVADRA